MIRCGYCGRFVPSRRLSDWANTREARIRCDRLACARAMTRAAAGGALR